MPDKVVDIRAFEPFNSADILRSFPPFHAQIKLEGELLTKQDALRAWRWRHSDVASSRDSASGPKGKHRAASSVGK